MQNEISTRDDLMNLIERIVGDGVFFGAQVRRRRDGTRKHWNAKSLQSVRDEYDKNRNLLTVFDVDAGHPKSIALEGIEEIRCYGQTYTVSAEALA